MRVLRREFFMRSSKSTLAFSLIWHLYSFSSELKDSISSTDLKISSAKQITNRKFLKLRRRTPNNKRISIIK